MAALLAKQAYSAFNREKPHSSITEWIEILTSENYEDEAYDGIPELVDSINIQATGTSEASRGIRKKLKHGDSHHQYRALVILGALVLNGGHKFQTSFADSHLTDALKTLATDPSTDTKVKKKLLSILAGWHTQFKGDPSMSLVANLYTQIKPISHQQVHSPVDQTFHVDNPYAERKQKEEQERKRKEEEKRKAKEAKDAERRKEKEEAEKRKRTSQLKVKRKTFDFEQEKPNILTAIANASQASSNLVNAITLVNTEHDSLQENHRVQECLVVAKQSRKQIVRYVQLVENEEVIGTLIETNDRIIAALDMYDTLTKSSVTEDDVKDVQAGLAAVKINDSEIGKLQEKQRAAVQRSIGRAGSQTLISGSNRGKERARIPHDDDDDRERHVHPDLQDLEFGSLGPDQRGLPAPLRPSTRHSSSEDDDTWRRGSLSDFSDYQSSDEETHNHPPVSRPGVASGSSHISDGAYRKERGYVDVSDNEVDVRADDKAGLMDNEDPFADPFADQDEEPAEIATPSISSTKRTAVW